MYYVLHFFKMQDKLGSREEVFLHGAGYSTVYPLSGEKADCCIHSPEDLSMLCGAKLQGTKQGTQRQPTLKPARRKQTASLWVE